MEAGHLTVVDEGWAKSVRITSAGREHLPACFRAIDGALGRLRHIPDLDLIELGADISSTEGTGAKVAGVRKGLTR